MFLHSYLSLSTDTLYIPLSSVYSLTHVFKLRDTGANERGHRRITGVQVLIRQLCRTFTTGKAPGLHVFTLTVKAGAVIQIDMQ